MKILVSFTFVVLVATGCVAQTATETPRVQPPPLTPEELARLPVDTARVLGDLRFLADTAREGRRTGTPGNEEARQYIEAAFREAGLLSLGDSYLHPFALDSGRSQEGQGVNVIGYVRGRQSPDEYIVVTAHYDHLGNRGGTIYPGADDNASGTAALLEIARQVARQPGRRSIIFAALDAEEIGLQGARAFLANPPVPLEAIELNINLDMVSRSEANELYAAGTYHHPGLLPLVEAVADSSRLELVVGHDQPNLAAGDDWTMLSDHGAFHERGIPFIYFGVEDHVDYHRPTDTYENLDPIFFVRAVATILDFIREADERWERPR